eukprot:Hpha_TRINITY_DN15961_c0_g5::TRINITY_DN15961_c0_g5_i1::g.71052::m.71052
MADLAEDGDWTCTACGAYPCFASRTTCFQCGAFQGDTKGGGHWTCKSCGAYPCYASRYECFRCGDPRDSSSSDDDSHGAAGARRSGAINISEEEVASLRDTIRQRDCELRGYRAEMYDLVQKLKLSQDREQKLQQDIEQLRRQCVGYARSNSEVVAVMQQNQLLTQKMRLMSPFVLEVVGQCLGDLFEMEQEDRQELTCEAVGGSLSTMTTACVAQEIAHRAGISADALQVLDQCGRRAGAELVAPTLLKEVESLRRQTIKSRQQVRNLSEDIEQGLNDDPGAPEELREARRGVQELSRRMQDVTARLWNVADDLPDIRERVSNLVFKDPTVADTSAEVRALLTVRGFADYDDIEILAQNAERGRVVYKGTFLGEPAAIKQFTLMAGSELKRLRQEVKMYAQLQHPCVAQVCAAFYEVGKGYIHFKLYERDLAAWMKSPPEAAGMSEILKMIRLMLSGLEHIHSKRCVHADISASNVVVSSEGVPVFIDFEFSTGDPGARADATVVTVLAGGTQDYVAPELLKHGRRDPELSPTSASDVYALGVVIEEMIMAVINSIDEDDPCLPQLEYLAQQMTEDAPESRPSASAAHKTVCEIESESHACKVRGLHLQVTKEREERERVEAEVQDLHHPQHWEQLEGHMELFQIHPRRYGASPGMEALKHVLESTLQGQTLLGAWSLQNRALWRKYAVFRTAIGEQLAKTPPPSPGVGAWGVFNCGKLPGKLVEGVNERWLLHGTTLDAVPHILREGFNERFSRDGLYGRGNYFAEDMEKCLNYAPFEAYSSLTQTLTDLTRDFVLGDSTSDSVRCVFLSRVTLGWFARPQAAGAMQRDDGGPLFAEQGKRELSTNTVTGHRFNSVLASSGATMHREVIIYNGCQAYPEYFMVLGPAS